MRIERHQVGEAAVSAAREDFTNRIGRQVHSMSRAGRMATYEWQSIADEFLDYLGALSVETPDLDSPEAKAALKDASEAAVGAVAYAAYHPHCSFNVFLEYVNFGVSYDPGDEAPEETVTPGEWTDALCLSVLRDKVTWHGEEFTFARRKFAEQAKGTPGGELATGLTAVVLDDAGDGEYSPSARAKLAALDAALDRIRARAEQTGEPLLDRPDSLALRTLRALTTEDREAFDAALADLLTRHAALHGPTATPSTLLPLVPIALAALAYRTLGWAPAVHTEYLPHALVTGFETQGPRVAGFGRNPRPDAVAALATSPLVVERPACERDGDGIQRIVAMYEEHLHEAFTPVDGKPLAVWHLTSVLEDQRRLFQWRAGNPGDLADAQLATLRLASQVGAALFRVALAEPDTEVEVSIGGRTLRYPAKRGREAGAGYWHMAVAFALITGVREDLAPLVLTGPTFAGPDGSASTAYREALHSYLTGTEPEAAAQRALQEAEKAKDWGFAMPPAVLLSQLVEGNEESFNLALADALEAHRAYYQVADRADSPEVSVNLDVLALACHARRRGWAIRVESPYLPQHLLRAAEPL
ncbi:Imm49 family immunity protein [Streptomyces sp. NPDC056944]|uniref:immunity 49 family protein n=1 Tax=Streptomyces sp. NPDC056944 TaxID=3345972 RepID=UPI0036353F55